MSRLGRLVALLLACALWLVSCGESPDSFEITRVQRDALEDLDRWEILEAPDAVPPSVETLALALDPLTDSGDLPALVMAPPCAVRYEFPAGDAPAILRAAAGVNLSVPRKLKVGSPTMRVRFRAELDGELVFEELVDIEPKARNQRISSNPPTWSWIGGQEEGLEVRGGQALVLRTELLGPHRMPLEDLKIGFGGLVTETTHRRERARSSPTTPNIVLFVMDTERADRCSTFGYEKPTTPHLDQLAARGVAYDDAWSTASWTWPSTASLLTGLDALGHGVTSPKSCYLAHELATLPKTLQERGYTTGGFSCNPLITANKNFDEGFERFEERDKFTPGVEMMPLVLDWVRAHAGKRFFLYVHLVDPHAPHRPLPAELARLGGERPTDYKDKGFESLSGGLRTVWAASRDKKIDYQKFVGPAHEQWIHDAYDACVATGDHHLGSLLALLDELELTDETVIAYTSDHGEELFDHRLLDHAHTLHPELLHVPLVIAGPGIPRGVRNAERVSNRHVASTLARFGSVDLEAPAALDLADPTTVTGRDQLIHTAKGIWNDRSMMPLFGLVEDDWALHWASRGVPYGSPAKGNPGDGQWQLFDRRSDPTEQHDVSEQHPEVAQRMRALLVEWRDERERMQPKTHAAGASTRNLLRGVGYVDGAEEEE